MTGDGADPYLDPQGDRGEGNYITKDEVPETESEAVNHITEDNGVRSDGTSEDDGGETDIDSGGSGGGYGGGVGVSSSSGSGGGSSASGGGATSSGGGGSSSTGSGGGGVSIGGISLPI